MSKKKQAEKPLYPAVTVKWVDTFTLDNWVSLDDAKLLLPLECATTGYLIYESEEHIVLAQTIGAHGKCFGTVAIPRPTITEILKDE